MLATRFQKISYTYEKKIFLSDCQELAFLPPAILIASHTPVSQDIGLPRQPPNYCNHRCISPAGVGWVQSVRNCLHIIHVEFQTWRLATEGQTYVHFFWFSCPLHRRDCNLSPSFLYFAPFLFVPMYFCILNLWPSWKVATVSLIQSVKSY